MFLLHALPGKQYAFVQKTRAIIIDQRLLQYRHQRVIAQYLLNHPVLDVDGRDGTRLATFIYLDVSIGYRPWQLAFS